MSQSFHLPNKDLDVGFSSYLSVFDVLNETCLLLVLIEIEY